MHCPFCLQEAIVTKHDTIKTHRYDGRKCAGSGMSALGYFRG